MVAQQPYIIYKLPISRITQALKGREISKVWSNVQYFLTNCTTANINNPQSIDITAFSAAEDHGESPEPADSLIKKAHAVFGVGETNPIGFMYPSGVPAKQTKTNWKLTSKDLTKALNYLIEGQPYPKYNLGPIELILSYDFKLIDPIQRNELPNQQYVSSVLIWLSRSNCVSVSLCFPFVEPNQEFWNYIDRISPFIPFKFDNKFLRLGRSNKKGTANVFSKL